MNRLKILFILRDPFIILSFQYLVTKVGLSHPGVYFPYKFVGNGSGDFYISWRSLRSAVTDFYLTVGI